MLNWEKLGKVFTPVGDQDWNLNSALTPTPLVMEDRVRVYAGFRDQMGISRIGYADLDLNEPTKVIGFSSKPVLDIGKDGNFDDNGVILGDVINVNGKILMYYVGFQLVVKAKFLAFTGLAMSNDGGNSFERFNTVPVLDRRKTANYFNAIHTVIYENGIFKCWLGSGSDWSLINDVPYPSYNIKYIESPDGINFGPTVSDAICFENSSEYRIGRPRVYKYAGGYFMIYTKGDLFGNYTMGFANSVDGINWVRNDKAINFFPSSSGWDDKWVSYGTLFTVNGNTYMLYNGNEMGKEGFGIAKLINKII